MKLIEKCAWCGKVIGSKKVDDSKKSDEITHGICAKCEKKANANLDD